MASSTNSLLNLDPQHISCIGGRTVLTCKSCAGNAPRGSICTSCNGRGFNIFICVQCNPTVAAAAATARATANLTSASAGTGTPGSSAPSSPGSLSRSSSTSYPSHPDPRVGRSWGRRGTSCGSVETNTNTNTPRNP
ncbi:hypothetical protein PENARI_c020G07289 [Penicillium arizonense]|uniref:Uncharacterized protein n=1 Tax=Penicillium arizonense TaxID=1835702 RepID=A0A1F5L935_PENAI|nr:hypothetical protein PENARI_c020G07289 [Penicillium arizonense]OGE49577.1 hypothetical protein PENARI_c020G07289 [Penicillium arizonense]